MKIFNNEIFVIIVPVHTCTLITTNALCIWCDDVIANVLSVPRPHTDSGECD